MDTEIVMETSNLNPNCVVIVEQPNNQAWPNVTYVRTETAEVIYEY